MKFQKAKNIILKLETAGYEAYVVGGAVRDLLLEREVNDIDIVTSASPCEIKQLFSKTIEVGVAHGTVMVIFQGDLYEVTSYRGTCLTEDLKLRDFTMNAICLSRTGEVIDPLLGKRDIDSKTIRCVENPTMRFQEDPLRMLRAIRFVSQLGFTIEDETLRSIMMSGELINNVAIERISVELEKIWFGTFIDKGFQSFRESNLLGKIKALLPLQKVLNEEKSISILKTLRDRAELWAVLLYLSDNHNPSELLKSWKQSNKLIVEVEKILGSLPVILQRGFTSNDLYRLGLDTSLRTERIRASLLHQTSDVKRVNDDYNELAIKQRSDLPVNGRDIAELLESGDPPSKIGEIMQLIENAVVTKKVRNEKNDIITWLREEGHVNAQ